jgi:predicted alpha/beta superfamily hydrolase
MLNRHESSNVVRASGLLALLACALAAIPAAGQSNQSDVVLAQRHVLHSAVMQEDRVYWVYVPPTYENPRFADRRYPVLYLLDGGAHLQTAVGVVHQLASFRSGALRIPEMIIVAVPNTKRTRDLTPIAWTEGLYTEGSGGGPKFFEFLTSELTQEIDANYRTLPYRTLAGHSLGGLFALSALLTRADGFQAFIAMDPSAWWGDEYLLRTTPSFTAAELQRPQVVFISRARLDDDPLDHGGAIERLVAALHTETSPQLRVSYRYFADEDHMSVPLQSLYVGLQYIFDGYAEPADLAAKGPEAVRAHYARISARLGTELTPPPSLQ